MAGLRSHEKVIFERLFDRDGWVLNFTNRTFAEFFREYRIDIEDQKYQFNGPSKMKRLRAFWEIEPDFLVGTVLEGLLNYACAVEDVNLENHAKAVEIICRLKGDKNYSPKEANSENDFLSQNFPTIDWVKLQIDVQLQQVLQQRIEEIEKDA